MYRYLLFDLDGTLTDSQEGIVKSARYAMEQLGDPPLDDVTMLQFLGPPLQESFRRFCGYDPEKTQRALAIFRGRYGPIGQFENRGTPGMAEALARLKAEGYVLAVASSKPINMCHSVCRRFGFASLMDAIAGSPPEGDWTKADVIRDALRQLGAGEADKPAVLMIGDRKYDCLGAKECGIDCLGVEFFGYAEAGELEQAGAAAIVRSVEEMEAWIRSR